MILKGFCSESINYGPHFNFAMISFTPFDMLVNMWQLESTTIDLVVDTLGIM